MSKRQFRHLVMITATVMATLCASTFAQAGDRGYRDGHGRYYGHAPQHYRHATRRHHYRPAYRHHPHHGRHALRTGLKVAAGAVLLGAIVHTITDDRRDRVVHRTRTPAPRTNSYYRIDPDGACVEVTYNRQGQEVWTYVDQAYCY